MKEKRLNILILEDNPDDAELIVRELEKAGFVFEWKRVETEKEFKKALFEKPDIILTDYKLPSFNGMSAIKLQQQIASGIPLILVSGTIGEERAVECLKAGATDYVLKDRLSRLATVIKRALKEAEAYQKKEATEKELIEREKELNFITESNIDTIFILTKTGKITYVSKSAKDIFGFKAEEIIGTSFTKYVPKKELPLYWKMLKEVFLKKKVQNFKTNIKNRNGNIIPVEINGQMIKKDGKLFGQGTIRNITERKKAEEELSLSKTLLRDIMDLVPVFICAKNLDGRFILVNKKLTDFYGTTVEEMTDMLHADLCKDENELRAMLADDRIVIESGKPKFISEETMKNPDGSITVLETTKIPFNAHGEPAVLIAATDITKRKRAEEALRESEEKFRAISESAIDSIFIKDINLKYIHVNPAMEKLFGLPASNLIGKTDIELFGEEAGKHIIEKDKEVIKGEILIDEHEKTVRGELHTFHAIKVPLKNSEGKIIGLCGIARDITEKKQAEEDLKSALEKATESDRLKSVFLSTMSHELRTPLNAVIGFSEIIADSQLSEEEIKDFANNILTSGSNLLSIVNDIFDITLIETDKVEINKEKISINKTLESIYSSFIKNDKILNKKINLIIKKELGEGLDIVNTDNTKFRQILINLIGNAFKFTHQGTIEFGYKVKTGNNTSFLQFYVNDTGIGIPEDKISIIFERFSQADDSNTRQYGGMGLGLAISEKLVELLGGKIWVESEEGKGSTFYFTLPFEPVVKITDVDTEKPEKYEYDWKSKTILVVDDFFLIYKYFESVLKETNAKLIWAKDGKEAISLFKSNKEIDMVLMDIQLPDINGYEVTKQIKKINKEIPVIAQTAYALAGDYEKALEAGCDDYITKPINKDELLTKMIKLLDG